MNILGGRQRVSDSFVYGVDLFSSLACVEQKLVVLKHLTYLLLIHASQEKINGGRRG